MARIRSIKPEFPQSESMGRVSRDARLTFIQLWTIADDAGRLRGNSRMLASLLFPYDDDARDLISGWLDELEREHCITRYQVNGDNYIQISNWLTHQKIDKPSQSKIPEFDESSRILANPRERSSEDQGSRIKDQGKESSSRAKSDEPFYETKKGRKLKGDPLLRFEQFWTAFDYKSGRAEAADAWYDLSADDATFEQIISAAKAEAARRPKLLAEGKTPKMAQGWLSGRRWEDKPLTAAAQNATPAWKKVLA